MLKKDQYPRVLIVLMTKVKADAPCNLEIRTQFGDWPQEGLAQIHGSAETQGHGEFCGHYYRLQACDRFLGGLFRHLRGGVMEMVAMDEVNADAESRRTGPLWRWARVLKKRLGDWLIGSGLWELIFRVRLSEPMLQFVEAFKPDLIYCQGYSLGFVTLPLLIARRFSIPICFQTTDDWPSYTYRGFPMGWILRRHARQLVAEAKVRMALGEKMRQSYEKRYQRPFLVTYHADRFERFAAKLPEGGSPARSITYTGHLALRRYEAVNDLLQAVRSLDSSGPPLEIRVYCSGIPKELPEVLRNADEVKFLPLPSHDALPAVLAEADILFLPESFSVDPAMLDLSLSSKCHLYMMSGRPVLAYGPPYSGTIDYARREGWAVVVAERSAALLRVALQKLLADPQYKSRLLRQSSAVARRNHELLSSRDAFRHALISICTGADDAQRERMLS